METALAMALGASVAPEMMVTPMTSARMPSRTGWSPACERNTERVNSMPEPYPDEADRTQTHLPILAQRAEARKMTLWLRADRERCCMTLPCCPAALPQGRRGSAAALWAPCEKCRHSGKIHKEARASGAILGGLADRRQV